MIEKFDLKNFSSRDSEQIYNLAILKMNCEEYESAKKLLNVLLFIDGGKLQYIKAIAGCYHALNDFENAIFFYEVVFQRQEQNNQDCLFYLGKCYLQLKNYDKSRKYLRDFLVICANNNELSSLYHKQIMHTKLLLGGILLGC